MTLIGGVEGGGTKFLAAVARPTEDGPPEILDRLRVATTNDPALTLQPIAEWLAGYAIEGLGIATFGPLDLKTGRMRDTPKPGWSGIDVVSGLLAGFEEPPPTTINTDVSGAGVAEWRWGSARGSDIAVYVTVGTGIGGGLIVGGRPVHGRGHPEMGHVAVARIPDDPITSVCPFHSSCLEGLASGPAFAGRAGRPAHEVDDHVLWGFESQYLATGLAAIALITAADVIVLGGGVMQRAGLVEEVAERLTDEMQDYHPTPQIRRPHFGHESGLYGALALAVS